VKSALFYYFCTIMNKTEKISIHKRILGSSKFMAIILSLVVAFSIWAFLTLSQTYIYTISYPIIFVDKYNNKAIINPSDSIINVQYQSTGFDQILQNRISKLRPIIIDINELRVNKSFGVAKIRVSSIKDIIIKNTRIKETIKDISPDNIVLHWQRTIKKKVKVISNTKFEFKKSYYLYSEPKLFVDEVIIEGPANEIRGIDTIFTKDIKIKNIDKSTVFFIPLQSLSDSLGIRYYTNNVPIQLLVDKFTEDEVELLINKDNIQYDSIKLFPSTVKLKYRIAVKDYKRFDKSKLRVTVENNFDIRQKRKLKVHIENIPDYVKIISLNPEKVDYIIFR